MGLAWQAAKRGQTGLSSTALAVLCLPLLVFSTATQSQQTPPAVPQVGWGAVVAPPAKPKPKATAKSPDQPPGEPALSTEPVPAPVSSVQSRAVDLAGDKSRTRLSFDVSAPLQVAIYRLSEPYRVIVDLAAVEFALPPGTGRQGRGLVTAFRYGLIAEGRSRIVIDTAGPVRVESAKVSPAAGGRHALVIELAPTSATELAAEELATAASVASPDPTLRTQAPPTKRAPKRERPVIVIDPGHGGIDSGAQGALGLEKDLVLAVAQEMRRALLATRRYDVVMTRATDVFVSLDQRVRVSMQHQADLFVSVHADSLAARELAQSIRGATLYVLSEKASDDRARRMAEKENAADLVAGLPVVAKAGDAQVRDILIDLMRRESATMSSLLRTSLIAQMRPRVALAKEPARAAPFKVLRQPGSPAVLIELGYISNAEDEKLMRSGAWQKSVAEAVTYAVNEHFRRQGARQP